MRTPTNPDDFIVIINISEINARNTSVFDHIQELIERQQYHVVLYDEGFSFDVAAKVPKKLLQKCILIYGRGRNLYLGEERISKDFNNPAIALAEIESRRFFYVGHPSKASEMFIEYDHPNGRTRKLTARTPSALAACIRQLFEPKPRKKRKPLAKKKAK